MTITRNHLYLLPVALATALVCGAQAEQEGPTSTQALVAIDAKAPVTPAPSNITIKVDNRSTPLTSITPVLRTGAQVALLIDDGLRTSVGRELSSLQKFVETLPAGTEIFIGYMQNGRVVPAQQFTTDYAAAARSLHIPSGVPGSSASPYFCLSDFIKKWPSSESSANVGAFSPTGRKARFVLMITDGVDPYNGSTSPLNQNSPYVEAAARDAERSGIPVYSIYFSDTGFRGGRASFSGQSYLSQVANGTGGRAYYIGTGNPVSMAPFLTQFQKAIADTYIATFDVPGGKNLVRIKLATNLQGTKVRAAEDVRPGTHVSATEQ
jgi:hypothetical protein